MKTRSRVQKMFPFSEIPAEVVENDQSIIFGLDGTLRLIYCNPSWDRFASANGGDSLRTPALIGRYILDYIPETLRRFYEAGYSGVLCFGEPWEHLYECSSASVFRKFLMRVLPMRARAGLLVINSLRVEYPYKILSCKALDKIYREQNGRIVMCSHCRRTRRNLASAELWDWVADFVRQLPPGVSHGLCNPCLAYYYPRESAGEWVGNSERKI